MTDKDFEIEVGKAAELLTNAGYFTRYRNHLATMNCRAAWEATESELPFGLRRFLSFEAFKNALTRERNGHLSETVRLQK